MTPRDIRRWWHGSGKRGPEHPSDCGCLVCVSRAPKAPSLAPAPSGLPAPPPEPPTPLRGGEGACRARCEEHIARRCSCAWCSKWRCWACGQTGGGAGLPDLSEAESNMGRW